MSARPLESPEISVKLFVEDPAGVRLEELVPVFHRWIREGALEDEVLVDVATYEHVPNGPGVVLIGDTGHWYLEVRGGRPGLRFRGRRESRGVAGAGLDRAFRSALWAASLLQGDPALGGRYRFGTSEIELGIYDRLRAPSDDGTLEAVLPELSAYLEALYGEPTRSLERTSGPKEPFTVSIRASASPTVEDLLGRVTASGR